MLIAACGGDAGAPTTAVADSTTTTAIAGSTTTTTVADTTTTTAVADTTTTTARSTTTTAPARSTTLAGDPIDFGPADGDVLMVVGVRHDDVLNLRAAPGASQPIADEIPPTYANLVAQGNTRDLSPGLWIEVDYAGTPGWVNMRYTAFGGNVTDETSTVIDELGERPTESTMADLGELVADVFDSRQSNTVQVTKVVKGDLSEITYDVVGLGGDSVLGFRLHVFAEDSGGGFTLRSVEATLLCARSVSDGLCV